MLQRSASSRRRKASRNVMSSNSTAPANFADPKGRRASLATDKPILLSQGSPVRKMKRQRSPRCSVVPNISVDAKSELTDEDTNHRILPDIGQYNCPGNTITVEVNRSPEDFRAPDGYYRSPRNSVVADMPPRSPRNSLVPEVTRSPRHSLTPDMLYGSRHSLAPDTPTSSRHSLAPDVAYNRSPRNSLVPLTGSRASLMPENGIVIPTRTSRHSLTPDPARSPRGSVTNLEMVDRRESLCPEMTRSPRGSITHLEMDRSPRSSIVSECINQSPRGSIVPDINRSPRTSIVSELNRSPRNSISRDGNRNCHDSIISYEELNRSPRGSIRMNDINRHSRGSIGHNEEEIHTTACSVEYDVINRTPRSSLGSMHDRRAAKGILTLPDPRRASADQESTRNRSSSPFRQGEVNTANAKAGTTNAHVNHGYGVSVYEDSRRASSSVSQFSADESRQLFTSGIRVPKESPENVKVKMIPYGSIVFQLKDANFEANGVCDFVLRAMKVVSKASIVTVCLACLCLLPVLMFIFGLQFFDECRIEPRIPVYMVVGGIFGALQMSITLYSQIRSKRTKLQRVPQPRSQISLIKLVSITLPCFLLCWFGLGNYWIFSVMWPDWAPQTYKPDTWCNRELYLFSVVHLFVVHAVFVVTIMVAIGLAFFRIFACPWLERYT